MSDIEQFTKLVATPYEHWNSTIDENIAALAIEAKLHLGITRGVPDEDTMLEAVEFFFEEAPTTSVSSGGFAGLGDDDPPVRKKKRKRNDT